MLLNATTKYNKDVHQKIVTVFNEKLFKYWLANDKYISHTFDGIDYFANKLTQMVPPDFFPSKTDIIATRKKTIGVTETSFQYKKFQSN